MGVRRQFYSREEHGRGDTALLIAAVLAGLQSLALLGFWAWSLELWIFDQVRTWF